MARRIVVVGSGASGVHFALTLLKKGLPVTMVDVGLEPPAAVEPAASFAGLKEKLSDPVDYFLGERFQSVVLPGAKNEYYGFPPTKDFVFDQPQELTATSRGFEPLFSFAQGGLAEAWTAGCYPFNEGELADFPFSYADIEPHYGEVARRIGVGGAVDHLAQFIPVHDHLLPPLELDPNSVSLLDAYARKSAAINDGLGCYMGRTRVAVLSHDIDGRRGCQYLGRCLWGCPVEALYTPAQTLRACRSFSDFEYLGGLAAQHFKVGPGNKITGLVVHPVGEPGNTREIAADTLVLAAGTLCSTRIFLQSLRRESGSALELTGLMDNRQLLVPFVNPRMIGQSLPSETYQYHLIGLGLSGDDPSSYVHGQITTLKTALVHPFAQSLPFDLRTSLSVVRKMQPSLALLNLNFHDTRRETNTVGLTEGSGGRSQSLMIRYRPCESEPTRISGALKRVRKALFKLGCVIPPGMVHMRPMGASVHYTGTLPMSAETGSFTTTEFCESREFANLYLVDGSTFPFLPAKNLTFTLMANAVRVASKAF